MLILSFRDDEEHIINHILSYINRETEILHQGDVLNGQLYFEGLYIDEQKRIVVRENNEIELTYTEFEILLLLAQNIGKVFSKQQIYDSVWKEPYFGNHNIVMSHIRNLREKIEDDPSKAYKWKLAKKKYRKQFVNLKMPFLWQSKNECFLIMTFCGHSFV